MSTTIGIYLARLRQGLAPTRVAVIFGILYVVSQIGIAIIVHPLGTSQVLKLQTTFSKNVFQEIIAVWQARGLLGVYRSHYYLDFLHPVWYACFLASLLSKGLNANAFSNTYNMLLLAPFLAGALDILENCMHLILLSDLEATPAPLVYVSATAANLKWLLAGLSVAGVIVLVVRWALKNRNG